MNASGCRWLWEQHNLASHNCVHTGTCANKDLVLKILSSNQCSYTSIEVYTEKGMCVYIHIERVPFFGFCFFANIPQRVKFGTV